MFNVECVPPPQLLQHFSAFDTVRTNDWFVHAYPHTMHACQIRKVHHVCTIAFLHWKKLEKCPGLGGVGDDKPADVVIGILPPLPGVPF